MRDYFTNIPVCPNCFQPITSGVALEKLEKYDNVIFCPECKCYFKENILWDNEYFPLFNKINLNTIELAYIEWILNGIDGKFLITWPWETVDFIPILISQYLYECPTEKIVVFSDLEQFYDDSNELSFSNILDSLYFINNSNMGLSNDNLELDDVFVKYDFNLIKSLDINISKSFFECFDNKLELIPCFFDINYSVIQSKEDINIKIFHDRLIFIDEKLYSREIMDNIDKISPDLIIVMNIDSLYGKYRFKKHHPIYELYNSNFNLLLFSTDVTQRSHYHIGQEDYFLGNWDIIPHTWDYKDVLDEIYKMSSENFSICSSSISNIKSYKNNVEINFICCDELGKIEDTFEIFHELFSYDKNIKRTLEDLMKTPLYIKGLYRDIRVLNRNFTFEYLFSLVYNMDIEKWRKLVDIFDEVYGFNSTPKNPIINTLLESLKNLNQKNFVIIVHPFDIKGTKLILNDFLGENDILVTSFSDLNNEIKEKDIIHGISLLFPPTNYDINSSGLKKLDIICSPFNFERYDMFRKNRFTENGVRPIYLLDNEDAPVLLKTIQKGINIPDDYYYKINKTLDYGLKLDYNQQNIFRYSYLREGDDAVLILNEDGQGMFLKFNNVIYILDKLENTEDFEIKYDNYGDLIDKKLLISNFGYHSIGRIFLKFVIENGYDMELREDNFKWMGFEDLIKNMFLWVDSLKKIIDYESNNSFNTNEEIKNKIAKELSQLNLSARREIYIKNIWLDDPKPLETEFGQILIYESERPKSKEDLIKIFDWMSKNYEFFSFTKLDAIKCYTASGKLKKVRNKFIKTGSSNLGLPLNRLRKQFKDFLNDETKLFERFNIASVKKVKIKKNVSPFNVIIDYEEYI